jgi:hypothetical protein
MKSKSILFTAWFLVQAIPIFAQVINEINYHSSDEFIPGDWVELYNPQPNDLDISGWVFKDEDSLHVFEMPAGTIIPTDGYLVLAEDIIAFDSLFPDVSNYIGPLGFGFSGNGELLRLYNSSGVQIDTVHYDDIAPWPIEPDGTGPTLELINPAWDNALAENWAASAQHGTPGEVNGNYVEVMENPVVLTSQVTSQVTCEVQPNPFHSGTFLRIHSPMIIINATLTIYNLSGHEARRIENISSSSVFISSQGLSAGLYIFRLSDKESRLLSSGRFIVY